MILSLLLACGVEVGFVQTLEKEIGDSGIQDSAVVVEDSVEPSFEPSNEPSSELNGTVGLVIYTLEQIACPSCMGVSQEISINFEAKFHDRIGEQHPTWAPDAGTCTQSLNNTVINVSPKNIGQSLTVQGGQTYLTPYYNGVSYVGTLGNESQYSRDTLLNVQSQDGSSFQFMSLHGFDSVEPWELRYVDPSYAFAAIVSKNGTNFSWAPNGSSGLFNITVAVYSPDGSQLLGYVSCTTTDSGYFNMPGNYFQSFPTWSLTAIHLTRILNQRVPYQGLGGYVDAQVEWSVVGTGHVE